MFVRFLTILALVLSLAYGYSVTPALLDAMASTNLSAGAVFNGNWKTRFDLARADTPFFVRAAVAQVGLGANQAEEALYWTTSSDNHGNPLLGGQAYTIQIPATMPEVAFWSITAYDADHFLIDNPADIYAITDRQYGGGTTSVVFSPAPAYDTLWLPNSPKEERVTLILRMYQPSSKFLQAPGKYPMPTVQRQ